MVFGVEKYIGDVKLIIVFHVFPPKYGGVSIHVVVGHQI